uniref:Glabrous enhancer-binding protein-like DBD domain-containing protein n=3 Tax=Brassica campestris TaxID=3711 RepID=M4EH41_BRACM
MANNPKHPLEDPPSSPSSSASEKEIESEEEEEEEGQHLHTIFSSEEDEPPRSGFKKDVCGSSESQPTGRKRLTTNSAISNVAKKVYTQGIIDSQVKNPLDYKRRVYESMKGSFSFDVTLDQFKVKIGTLKKKYTRSEMRGGEASLLNPHEQKCFQLSKAIWGADGVAFESSISYNSQSKDSERRGLTKKCDLVTPRMGKNAQEASKRGDTKKAPLVEKESTGWDDESSFFLGMDFLKEKWTKVPTTETTKGPQEKMKKLHANELECQKYEEMLKAMKDKCAHDKVELLNEVTSLIMAAD